MSNSMDNILGDSKDLFNKAVDSLYAELHNALKSKEDFTLRLEIRGDNGKICHLRNHNDIFKRPNSSA